MLKHINNVVREDSQTAGNASFARLGGEGKGGGGVTQERIPNFSNNQFFQAEKLPEILVSK